MKFRGRSAVAVRVECSNAIIAQRDCRYRASVGISNCAVRYMKQVNKRSAMGQRGRCERVNPNPVTEQRGCSIRDVKRSAVAQKGNLAETHMYSTRPFLPCDFSGSENHVYECTRCNWLPCSEIWLMTSGEMDWEESKTTAARRGSGVQFSGG